MKIQINGVIYRWSMKRFFLNLFIIALIAGGCFFYSTRLTTAHATHDASTFIVRKGDTLWSIAETIAPQTDPRLVIETIKADNNLTQPVLTVGQKLQINID